jgi:hypothetical protein
LSWREQAFGPVVNALNTFPEEKEIVRNEQSGKRGYSTFSYLLGRFIAELPLQIAITGNK